MLPEGKDRAVSTVWHSSWQVRHAFNAWNELHGQVTLAAPQKSPVLGMVPYCGHPEIPEQGPPHLHCVLSPVHYVVAVCKLQLIISLLLITIVINDQH